MEIRKMLPSDWEAVRSIYQTGIDAKIATFETQAPTYEQWDKGHLPTCRLVAALDHFQIAGWAALSPVSGRCVYGGVAEVSVYIDAKFRGQKVGQKLMAALISDSEQNGLWTLQAGIFAENASSIALHEKMGFRMVGYREKVGQLYGVWKDTVLLERRSKVVGI